MINDFIHYYLHKSGPRHRNRLFLSG